MVRSRSAVFSFLVCAAAGSFAADVRPPRLVSTVRLEGGAADALDVRWLSDREVLLGAGRKGTFAYDVQSGATRTVVGGTGASGGFAYVARLGISPAYIVTAGLFGEVAWLSTAPGATLSPRVPFDMILDADVYDDTLVVLGARRDAKGKWAPEGAIAWIGSLRQNLRDLRPLHYSEFGSEPKSLNNCHYLGSGAARFLRDGTLLVIPTVEQGMYLYDRSGKLLKTWPTEGLGFRDRCDLTAEQIVTYSVQPTARWKFLNSTTVLDEVIPLPGIAGGAGLIKRTQSGGAMRWTLHVLRDGKVQATYPLPVTAGERAALRADVRGRKVALLIIEYRTDKNPDGARLLFMEL